MWSDPFVPHPAPQPKYPVPITKENLQRIFGDAGDFTLREVLAGPEKQRIWVCSIDGLVSSSEISDFVMKPLMQANCHVDLETAKTLIYNAVEVPAPDMDAAAEKLVNGFSGDLWGKSGGGIRGENRGEAFHFVSGGGEHHQRCEGCVYGNGAHEYKPVAAASQNSGAAAGGAGGGTAEPDQRDHLFHCRNYRSQFGAGSISADQKSGYRRSADPGGGGGISHRKPNHGLSDANLHRASRSLCLGIDDGTGWNFGRWTAIRLSVALLLQRLYAVAGGSGRELFGGVVY